jgi:hypothetical protein
MSYNAFSSIVLVLIGLALITFRRPLSRLQLAALANFDRVRKNPTIYLKRLRAGAIIFGVLFMILGTVRYFAA